MRDNVSDRLEEYPFHLRLEYRLSRSKLFRTAMYHGVWQPRRMWQRLKWRVKKGNRPDSLIHHAKSVYSQSFEDGLLVEIFNRIGPGDKYAVEFGISFGTICCTRHLIQDHGWQGVLMDGGEENVAKAKQLYAPYPVRVGCHFITLDNIVDVFRSYGVPERPDLLVVDIDGNDYWILGALLQHYRPRVVVAEYNPRWVPPTEWVMRYKPDHVWDWTWYYGASLTSMAKLCGAYGYHLVVCDPVGVNAFFVRQDELKDRFPDAARGVGYHYVPPAYWHFTRKNS
jgi:hypothetical protein